MTCREKLKLEYPDCVGEIFAGGCDGCPRDYGYLALPNYCIGGDEEGCTKCWDREVRVDEIKSDIADEIINAIAAVTSEFRECTGRYFQLGYHMAMRIVLEKLIELKGKYVIWEGSATNEP